MTKDKTEEIRKACIKANPEIVERKKVSRGKNYRETNSRYMKSEKGRLVHRRANIKYQQKPEVAYMKRMNQRIYDAVKRFIKTTTSDGTITRKSLEALYQKQKGLCAISGESLENGYHIDHVIPLSKEGEHTIKNVQLLLPRINLYKSNKLNYEYSK